jgi:hypothetical protein
VVVRTRDALLALKAIEPPQTRADDSKLIVKIGCLLPDLAHLTSDGPLTIDMSPEKSGESRLLAANSVESD